MFIINYVLHTFMSQKKFFIYEIVFGFGALVVVLTRKAVDPQSEGG